MRSRTTSSTCSRRSAIANGSSARLALVFALRICILIFFLPRAQLAEFSAKKIISSSVDVKMEVDSVASTPNGSVSDE